MASKMNKRLGLLSSEDNVNTQRMDPDENNERLSAQVKAIQVLSTVRAMQDEIQDINQQIEQENKKLQANQQDFNFAAQESSLLESEIQELVSEMGLGQPSEASDPSEVMVSSSSSSIGDALRILAKQRQRIQQQSKLIAEAQLTKAQASLQEQQKLRLEKDQLVSQIESVTRSNRNKAKLRTQQKRRDAFLERLKQKKAVDAHKALIEASNTRYTFWISKI